MIGTLCFAALVSVLAAESSRSPNVVIVITDDQGYGDFSLHGNPTLKTPHIDALGRESIRFERFFVNSFCSPTRAGLLTGRYPLRCGVFGVTHNKETMRSEEVTLAEMFRAAGYRTGCFGKWHNGEQFPYTPPGQGFDEFFGFHNGHWNNYFDTPLLRGAKLEPTKGYITDVLADEAIRFVRASRERPFFCYVAFNAPHSPFQAPDKQFEHYKSLGLDDTLAAYYAMCAVVDDNVGRLLAELDRLSLTENTIVVFLTDNGGTAGVKHFNAGMRGGKTSVHEGGTRVPLFVRWPAQLKSRRVVRPIAAHIDIAPTLLDLCGIAPPEDVKFDGRSLRPLLNDGEEIKWPARTLFTHNPINETNRYPGAVRSEQYRLVRELRGGAQGGSKAKANRQPSAWQLFDMQADPGQTQDIAAQRSDIVADLSGQYEAWFDDISSKRLARLTIQIGHAEDNPVTLHAPQAYFDGNLKFYAGPGYAHDWLTGWSDSASKVWFDVDIVDAGEYDVSLRFTCIAADAGSRVRVAIGEMSREVTIPAFEPENVRLPHRDEAGHAKYVNRNWGSLPVGKFSLAKGKTKLTIEPLSKPGAAVMDLKEVVLGKNSTPSLGEDPR